MIRGQYAFIIPKQVTAAGASKVIKTLSKGKIKPLGKGSVLVVPWSTAAHSVLSVGEGVDQFFTDIIPAADIKKMPHSEARIAKVWNWSIINHGRHVNDAAIKRLWLSLNLKVDEKSVYDTIEKKSLGTVKTKEEKTSDGNWSLWQQRGWTVIPGWFGWWEKLYCWSKTFQTSAFGGAYENVDLISAQVDGPNHYGYQSRNNAPTAYAEDWTYIWVGMTRGGRAYSYAKKGSTVRQYTSPNMWPSI